MRWLAVAMVAFAQVARADELDDLYVEANHLTRPAPRPIARDQIWYGWQTMTADAAFISAWALYPKWNGFTGDGALLFVDILGYSVVSPLIDALHDNVHDTSIAIRLTLPLVGSLLGLGIGTLVPSRCGVLAICLIGDSPIWGAFDGAVFGAGLAAAIDGIAFAWTTRKPKPDTMSWTVAPFGVGAGAGFGVSRTF